MSQKLGELLRKLNRTMGLIKDIEFLEIRKEIDSYGLTEKQQSSYISLCIRYYMRINNYSEVSRIINSGKILMKRDYLSYLTYLYKSDYEKAMILFSSIVSKYDFMSKDIKYIIDNNMINLCYYLENNYYGLDIRRNDVLDFSIMTYNNPLIKDVPKILDYIVSRFKDRRDRLNLDDSIKDVDVIIDGGNISYFMGKGKPTYTGFYNILKMVGDRYKNPLLIIHPRHLKNRIVKDSLKKTKMRYFITSRGINDDHYIVYSVIKNNCDVITQDNFRDHIFDVSSHIGDKKGSVRHYIDEKIIKYNSIKLDERPLYSKCIQIHLDTIYIPTQTGFIRLN